MGRVVYQEDEYLVVEDKNGHVIINTKGEYRNHGHIKTDNTAKLLIRLMKNKIVPDSNYLRETVLRISLDDDYKNKIRNKIEKDKNKQKYFNPQKGVIK